MAVDTRPFVKEIERNEWAWLSDTGRQSNIAVQRETQSIFLRSAKRTPGSGEVSISNLQDTEASPLADKFPIATTFLEEFAVKRHAVLGRALLARLPPGGQVYPHVDEGAYYAARDRYHFVICSSRGSVLKSGEELARMEEGQVWWFDNKKLHSSYNNSGDSYRVHLIFDLSRDE